MSVFGTGGTTYAIVRALWKRHERDLEVQLETTKQALAAAQQTISKLEAVIKELQSDIDAFMAETRRLNDARLDQAERRGTDNAESLLDVVRVLDETNRVMRDLANVMRELNERMQEARPSGRGRGNV